MIFRPIVPQELDAVLTCLRSDPSTTISAKLVRARIADGEYRPEWIWIAEDGPGRVPLALAIWWGMPDDACPRSLDALFTTDTLFITKAATALTALDTLGSAVHQPPSDPRAAVAAALLTAAHQVFAADGLAVPPEYHLLLPPSWRGQPEAAAAVEWRSEAAKVAGLRLATERLRFEWNAERPVPTLSDRLVFAPEPDDEVFVDLFRRALPGSLDAATTREALLLGPAKQARNDVAFYHHDMLGERSWWRIARTPTGQVVGFGIPSRNSTTSVVGYLGVVPEFRGRGFVAEILAEVTRVLVAEAEEPVIRADTDLTNHPMIAAFELLGYRETARRLVLSAN
ncbi:GNAT family N-acetyltransferase [Kitasatospora sp. NPDC059673]|uniref:GNAT family N-acetyltransferase n=1 Tax=Kitasatospora sp. NPDC059673 TaxID=3346901 RepID=UPI003695434D